MNVPDNLKDILSHLSPDIDQETLLLYLKGKLSSEKKHEVEKKLAESEFLNDAVEGLQGIRDSAKLDLYIHHLNKELKASLSRQRRKRQPHIFQNPFLMPIVILLLLLLVALSYFVIRYYMKG